VKEANRACGVISLNRDYGMCLVGNYGSAWCDSQKTVRGKVNLQLRPHELWKPCGGILKAVEIGSRDFDFRLFAARYGQREGGVFYQERNLLKTGRRISAVRGGARRLS
jgi:hypothetical protein